MIFWIVPEIEKKWTQPIIHNWGLIINQFIPNRSLEANFSWCEL